MQDESQLGRRATELLASLHGTDALALARRIGAAYADGALRLRVWQTAVSLTPPHYACQPPQDTLTRALLAYYVTQSDGTPPAREWIAFTALPDGQFYTAAFQGYTGRALALTFGNDLAAFAAAAAAAGGQRRPFADCAFAFDVLPHVRVLVAAWQGDDDFPPSYRILFDAHTPHHLPTDACAIVGSTLTRRLIAAAGSAGVPPA